MTNCRKIVTKRTYLQCNECDYVFPIFRKRHRMKEKNHVKHMYCPSCKEVKPFLEVKEDPFLPEWLREG